MINEMCVVAIDFSSNYYDNTTKQMIWIKKQIIKGLSEEQEELTKTKEKLDNLVSQPIWSSEVYPELDNSVVILQELNIKINELIDVQSAVLNKLQN